ncbi:MAG: FGGY family carbohydrate kinase [Thermodesulfobacteriota bacterium]|nr:FGGY family carbohydrate kinase [Thermodesulfobacteriota bacterium]
MLLLGYDIGSSSIKATLMEAETGRVVASEISPETEMEITANKSGWAEQDPEVWWDNVISATKKIRSKAGSAIDGISSIGIAYQMHGLVIVDKNQEILRPSIIWCDSRGVAIGDKAKKDIGADTCLEHLLNFPGNFTASKLKWVMENEPDIYSKIYKAMLPGDYIAMRMTGEISTTPSGLSEGIMWDFQKDGLAEIVLKYYGIAPDIIPTVVPTFSVHGKLTKKAADVLGLNPGIDISYRAGDQANNALSLNVLNPGQLAATAGTSGVVYGVGDTPCYDPKSRVNTFVHVNHAPDYKRYGVLLCVNGTGILNKWLKHYFITIGEEGISYEKMNLMASKAPVGSDGLVILPYGNGAERTLENKDIGASVHGLRFNIHDKSHYLRAAQEGIVFALNYGLEIMRSMGINITTVRAGNANMFLSPLFGEAFANVTGAYVELYNTDGAQGAARGAGIGCRIYKNHEDAFAGLKTIKVIEPNKGLRETYQEAYEKWLSVLKMQLE